MAGGNPLAALALAGALLGRHARRDGVPGREREPGSVRRVFLAEHYLRDLDARRVETVSRRLATAARALRHGGVDIRLLGSAGLPEDESFLTLFAAARLEEVRGTFERAGLVPDRIVPVIWREGDGR